MPGTVTMVRPDGTTFEVKAEDAGKFQTLGYHPQSVEAERGAQEEKGTQEFYTTPGEELKTAGEGLLSGATFGLKDLVFGESDEAKQRARYNPGIRLGSELLGGLASGESLLSPLAGGVAEAATGAPGIARSAAKSAIEGAVYGGGGAVTQARLNGDPLTAETVLAGVGWGTLFGGGLGAMGGAVEGTGVRAVERQAMRAIDSIEPTAYNEFRTAITDATSVANKAVDQAGEVINPINASDEELGGRAKDYLENQRAGQTELINQAIADKALKLPGARKLKGDILRNFEKIKEAAADGDFESMQLLTKQHEALIKQFSVATGLAEHPSVRGATFELGAKAAQVSGEALEELTRLKASASGMSSLAVTPEGFVRMTSRSVEKQAAALDHFMGAKSAELSGVQDALKSAVDKLVAETGLAIEGSPGTKLRAAHEALRAAGTKAAEESVGLGGAALKYAARKGADTVSHIFGGGFVARQLSYAVTDKLTGGLLGLKGAVMGRLDAAVAKWAPRGARLMDKAAPRVEPLKTRLDGTIEQKNKSREQLMEDRAKEIRDAAPAIRDTMYRAVAPFNLAHSEFAAAAHKTAVDQFETMAGHLPRDHGLAFSSMKSLWKPDPVETEKFARVYEVFQNPVAVAVRALETGHLTPEAASALSEMNPELMTAVKVRWLEHVAETGAMEKMPYPDQIRMGLLFGMQLHSTMDPRFITQQQMMFQERSKPLEPRPAPGMQASNNPSGGRPSPSMSPAQKIDAST